PAIGDGPLGRDADDGRDLERPDPAVLRRSFDGLHARPPVLARVGARPGPPGAPEGAAGGRENRRYANVLAMTASAKDCLFCKFVRGEIQPKKVYEDTHVLAFHNI